jgi:glycosyltransferase involved in cell wall biosynthesis
VKLLIVSQYFWPENFRVNDLATELRNRGHEITVLTGWPNYPAGKIYDGFSKYPKEYSSLNGVNILRVPLASRGQGALRLVINYFSFVISASLFGPLKLFRKKYDVIFVYEPSPITVGIPAILFKFIKKTPIVFWVLDLWPESLSAVGAVKSKTILCAIGLIVKFIYKNCDLILAQSKSFISGIEKYCDKNKIIEYFPSWSEELFHNELILPAPEIDKNENLFNILFAGNIGDAQDFPTILEAAEYLRDRRDIRWIIVGDGRMAGWLKAQVEERDLQSNIVITGRFPLERMPSFFVHADALLVTLKANDVFAMTIPGKVQTYLSSGLPIIGALDGEGAKVIHDAGAGYTCNAGDSKALSIVVEKMAALSNIERKAIGTAGRSYYAEHFEKKLLIDKLEHHFNNMVLSRGTTS